MNEKVCYLIGAGASAQVLPLVNDLKQRIKETIVFLNELESFPVEKYNLNPFHDFLVDLKAGFQFLVDLSGSSIDEEAQSIFKLSRKCLVEDRMDLHFSSKSKLEKIKKCLSFFFIVEELRQKRIDPRYTTFLHDITKFTNPNIKIFSWNYDSQIERAYANIFNCSISQARSSLSFHDCGDDRSNPLVSHQHLELVKLNGTADNFRFDKTWDVNFDFYGKGMCSDTVGTLSEFWADGSGTSLAYAFEEKYDDMVESSLRAKIKRAAPGCSHLIVVGYSFPSCNKSIDKAILDCCLSPDLRITVIDTDEKKRPVQRLERMLQDTRYKQIEIQHLLWPDEIDVPLYM